MVLQRAQDGWRELKAFVVDIDVGFPCGLNKGVSRLRAGDPSLQGVPARLTRLRQLFALFNRPVHKKPFGRFLHRAYASRLPGLIGQNGHVWKWQIAHAPETLKILDRS
jgi:hypothetical protein